MAGISRRLSDWDYLAGVSDETRMGALRLFSPDTQQFVDGDRLQAPPMTDLRELEAITAEVERGAADDTPERIKWLLHLAAPGSALGGARPKAWLREVDQSLWFAKFPSNDDRHDIDLWEYITYQLARRAGVDMPEARLMRLSERGHTYLVRRFDRHGNARRAYASALTLTDLDDSDGASYLDIVHAIENNGVANHIGTDLEPRADVPARPLQHPDGQSRRPPAQPRVSARGQRVAPVSCFRHQSKPREGRPRAGDRRRRADPG